jgi:hypothetical protein
MIFFALAALAHFVIRWMFAQQGIMGWLQTKYPEKFGISVDPSLTNQKEEA